MGYGAEELFHLGLGCPMCGREMGDHIFRMNKDPECPPSTTEAGALTRPFQATVDARMQRDPEFRKHVEDDKTLSYLEQENSVLHERVRKLEIALASEREACAKVAEEYGLRLAPTDEIQAAQERFEASPYRVANSIAALIRGRE